MKKIILIVAAAALMVALGIGIYLKVKVVRLPVEEALPGNVVFYLRTSDIQKNLAQFKSTRLWRNIQGIDAELLLEKSGLPPEQIAQFTAAKSYSFSFLSELFLDRFFGQEIALAVYPGEIKRWDPDAMLEVLAGVVLVTRVKPGAEFIEMVSKVFDKLQQEFRIKETEYRGETVSVVEVNPQLNIVYAQIKDLLIVGLGKPAVYACLDAYSGNKTALAQDRDYISTRALLPKAAQTIAYTNLELFFAELRRWLEVIPESEKFSSEQKYQILASFEKVRGLSSVGLAFVAGKISQTKIITTFDKSKMNSALARIYDFKPQKNQSINFVPKDVLAYRWSNCFDARDSWNNFQGQLARAPQRPFPGPDPDKIIRGIEEKFGISVESEIIPALDNEVGGFLSEINLEGPFPIPEIVFFVKVKDASAAEELLSTLIANNNLSLQSERYKDVQIRFLSLPFGKNIEPGYCFLEKYLLFSIRSKALRAAVDAFADKADSLLANPGFQAVNLGLTGKNNTVFFLKTDVLLARVKEICEWGYKWANLMITNYALIQETQQQQLDRARTDIQVKKQELDWLKTNFQAFKKAEAVQPQQLAAAEEKVKSKEEEIRLAEEELTKKQKQLDQLLEKSPAEKINPALLRLYLDEAIYPIIDGLQAQKDAASKSIFKKDIVEFYSFYKWEEEE